MKVSLNLMLVVDAEYLAKSAIALTNSSNSRWLSSTIEWLGSGSTSSTFFLAGVAGGLVAIVCDGAPVMLLPVALPGFMGVELLRPPGEGLAGGGCSDPLLA